MTKQQIMREVDAMIVDIITIDPSLQSLEKQLRNLLMKLINERPTTQFDENFKASLRAQLLSEAKKLSAKPTTSAWSSFTGFFASRRFAYASGITVLVAAIAIGGWMYVRQRPGNLLGYVTPPSTEQPANKLGIVSDDQFTLTANKEDSLGIDQETTFTFKSKKAIDLKLVTESLQVSPTFEYKVKSSDGDSFTFEPKDPLDSNTIYSFALAAKRDDGSTKSYAWAYQVKDTFKIMGTLPKDKSTHIQTNTGIEITFSTDQYKNPEKYIEISPKPEGEFKRYRKTVVFVPKSLQEKTLYTVTVKKGMPLENSDETLGADYTFQFETSSNGTDSYTAFQRNMYEFTPDETPVVSLTNAASGSASVKVFAFASYDLFAQTAITRMQSNYWTNYASNALVATDTLNEVRSFDTELQNFDDSYLAYAQLPDPLSEGQYLLQLTQGEKKIQTFLQVTPISAFLQGAKSNTIIWAHDTKTHQPLNQAVVTFSNDTAFTQKTNAEGVAQFDSPESIAKLSSDYNVKNVPTFFTVTSSGDHRIMLPVQADFSYDYYGMGGLYDQQSNAEYWNFLYTNRTLYAPTDTIKAWGVLKKRDGGKVPQATIEMSSTRYGASGETRTTITSANLQVSEFGTYEASLPYTNMMPNSYNIRLLVNGEEVTSKYIEVQSYVKPTFKLDVTPRKRAIFMGENAVFDVSASFFDGTPVQSLSLQYSGEFGTGSAKTDSKGNAVITGKTTYNASDTYYPRYLGLMLTTENSEITDISSSAYVYGFGPKYQIDLKGDKEGKVAGKVTNVDLSRLNSTNEEVMWDYTGTPVPNVKTHLVITRTYHDKIEDGERYDFINKKVVKKYRYESREQQIKELDVTTASDGTFSTTFTPTRGESYRVDATAKDLQGKVAKTTTYVYAGQYYDYMGADVYSLQSDKEATGTQATEAYAIGDNVNLSFKKNDEAVTPSSGAKFMYFQDHAGLSVREISDANTYGFAFEASQVPNAYMRGVYFDGTRYFVTSVKNLIFNTAEKKLTIDVTKDKESYRPGEKVNLKFHVTDASGEPVESEVNVSMIDEALAALQWNSRVYTLQELYGLLPKTFVASYASHKEVYEMSGGAEGGGCFSGDTSILMANDEQTPIADVALGDLVKTRKDPNTNSLVSARVIGKTEHLVSEYLTINGTLKITPVHVVYLNGTWQPIANAKIGDTLIAANGEPVRITSIVTHHSPLKVYNLHIDEYHTFIAGNVYVHNEKAGGRQDFQDIAHFGSVKTDANGNATLQVTLPDNVTSWLTTVQAVTKDLQANGEQTSVVATLPFFVEFSLAKTYVTDDQPIIKVRTEGRELAEGDAITFTVTYPDLKKTETYTGKAFESVDVPLPDFAEGEHAVTITAKKGNLQDTVTKKATFLSTYLQKNVSQYATLNPANQIAGSDTIRTNVTFSNKEQGQFYQALQDMLWVYGDRLDQRLARSESQRLLNQYFAGTGTQEDILPADYQSDGGIAILPYASSDQLFTAKVLSVRKDGFDTNAAKSYFYQILGNRKSNQDEIAYALFGLANLEEPVLVDVQNFMQQDIKPELKLYLIHAMANIGAVEQAKALFIDFLNTHGESQDPYIRIKLGSNDEMIEYTWQAAAIAAKVGMPEADALYQYALSHPAKTQLHYLEQIAYIAHALPNLRPGEVSFSYTLKNETKQVKLSGNETFGLSLSPEERKSITFTEINGQVGVMSSYTVGVNVSEETQDPLVGISRTYSVVGKQGTTFKDGDVVKVTLKARIDSKALDTSYQITDYLPSGLSVLTNPYTRGLSTDMQYSHPYEVNGQTAKFYSSASNREMWYYALVTGKGTFKADPAQIQGFVVKDSKAYMGQSQIITIK